MIRLTVIVPVLGALFLAGCVAPAAKPNDPYYAPVMPRTPMPAAATNGSIYQPGFDQNLYSDRKAFRVGDIITITLQERTQASKNASSDISKDSSANLGLTSLFGGAVSGTNPLTKNSMDLSAQFSGSRDNKGDSQAAQGNSLTGSLTVTIAEVLPNGVLAVRGEKWLTLNTGNELMRISGLVRADDIATDNTVVSTRVADARITYSGTGAFADASQPGWLSQFFTSPLWPF
ncbi:flagellar basal body L-ring protein FlgH [Pseudomonas kuykendallii]|uniref:Flagellar L-ring protein n=1 Tax=Pseudomonas kuykendallii TaxID=1007099 RepID=A0A1H3BRW7_9PSED|nr:flagellar basal body L-ring protein FlgH [Pseudomonas kuykendallii]MCQ4269819.1 flagellar basal body L-ring protein FlgH [Pseudomonas kuykendallii]SDX44556.1 flagellar L-ring protein precursor FlgH [Pseudomonas kuykendallii]